MSLILKTPSNGSVTLAEQDTASNVTVTIPATTGNAVVSTPDLAYSPYIGFRNRIINGAMVIDQRNAGAAVTTDGAFPVDRWKQNMSGGGVISGQRSTVAPANFVNSLSQTVTTADSSIAASDYYYLNQNIEGFNVADFGWGTASAQSITISFQVRSSITGTYAVAFGNSAFNRLYVATYTVNAANTWETKTVTIAGDTSGTWLTDNGIGLRVYYDLGSGSAYNATSSGSWLGAGVGIRLSSTVNWISTSGATFYITGVQLERGSVATPFEFRSIGQEFSLCERYYEVQNVDVSMPFPAICYANGVTAVAYTRFRTKKRAAPSVTFSGVARMVFPSNIGGSSGTLSANVINTDATQTNSTTTISTASAGWFDNYSMFASSEL
jgi:hypothetical protein